METRTHRWGNSLAVRIPKLLADEAGLKDNSPVQITLRDGKLVVVPIIRAAYSLDSLLELVTNDNLHHEVDTGAAVGGEAW